MFISFFPPRKTLNTFLLVFTYSVTNLTKHLPVVVPPSSHENDSFELDIQITVLRKTKNITFFCHPADLRLGVPGMIQGHIMSLKINGFSRKFMELSIFPCCTNSGNIDYGPQDIFSLKNKLLILHPPTFASYPPV